MLAVFPLTTARDRRWWSRCRSLGSPEMSTSFFVRQLKTEAVDLTYTPVVSIATVVKKNCQEGHCISGISFFSLSISCYTAWYSGTDLVCDYVVTFCKGVHNCCVPYNTRLLPLYQGFRVRPSGLFYLPSGQRAQALIRKGQRGDQCGSMIV